MFGLHHQASAATLAMFTALGDDTHDRVDGEIVVRGELPRGLSGVLFRNGPWSLPARCHRRLETLHLIYWRARRDSNSRPPGS